MKAAGFSVLFLTMISGVSSAAFLATVEFCGFSDDGKYAAFEQYWIADGSGFPGAEAIILSIPDSRIVWRFKVPWTEEMMYKNGSYVYYENSENPARQIIHEEEIPYFDSLGISVHNEGVHCICHPLTDTGVDDSNAAFTTWVSSPTYNGPEYNLSILNHQEMPESPPDWLTMFDIPVLLELNMSNSSGDTVIHLLDRTPLEGYEYVSSYRIRDVYVFRDSLVTIILNTTEPGFEGPDGKFRMVTGIIDY